MGSKNKISVKGGKKFMIFYFSGSGNSLYVAQRLHGAEGGELINITDALNAKKFNYKVSDGEKLGIVFPVYFNGLPTVVAEFMDQVRIDGPKEPFIYTVITCGSSIGQADKMLANLLKGKYLKLSTAFSVEMPSNYVMIYDTYDDEKQNLKLQGAEKQIKNVLELLKANKRGNFSKHGFIAPLTPLIYKLYGIYRKTKKFYATDACNGCGLCEKICPENAIQIANGRPEWIKERCSHCTACINRCPTMAIQYGKATEKRGRYINPNVKFEG